MKHKFITLFILGILNIGAAKATDYSFKLNYKNLNSLSSLICKSIEKPRSYNKVHLSQFTIDETTLNESLPNEINQFEITGNCNNTFSLANKSLISLGDEINLKAKSTSKGITIKGDVGLFKIDIKFSSHTKIEHIEILNPFLNKSKLIGLSRSQWAKSDSTFSFHSADKLLLKKNGKKVANEKSLTLYYSKQHIHYNIWSFSSFGCSSKSKISKKSCESFLKNT